MGQALFHTIGYIGDTFGALPWRGSQSRREGAGDKEQQSTQQTRESERMLESCQRCGKTEQQQQLTSEQRLEGQGLQATWLLGDEQLGGLCTDRLAQPLG